MKKILFSLFVVFSLFFINFDVFATTSLETLTFTREDYMELYMACVNKYDSTSCSSYRYRHVVYISGLDLDSYDVTHGNLPDDPVIQLYMAKSYINWHSDGIWTTYDNRNVNKGYLEVGKGMIITKNLITGNISVYDFPGSGSYTLGPMETYATNWLFLMADSDIEYNGQVLFDRDDNYNVSGSIQTGSGVIDNVDKSIIERVWDTIKGIFNTLVEGFKNMIDAILSLPEKIGNPFNGLISFVFPDQEYFETKIAVIDKLFSEELGFLYESFEFMFDIINRFLNIGSGSKIISIPTIKEPISGNTIINGTTLNFNDILSTSNIKTLHTLYLAFVDVIIFVGLLNLGRKEFDKVVGGHL